MANRPTVHGPDCVAQDRPPRSERSVRHRPPADVLLGPGSAGRHQGRTQKKTPNPAARPRYSRICQLPGSGAAPQPYSSRADGGSSPRSWPKPQARAAWQARRNTRAPPEEVPQMAMTANAVAASKTAVDALTRILANELGGRDITVNTVARPHRDPGVPGQHPGRGAPLAIPRQPRRDRTTPLSVIPAHLSTPRSAATSTVSLPWPSLATTLTCSESGKLRCTLRPSPVITNCAPALAG
jgi:NAD(P)-dependent dehydrogenase (short-subunit alcohol dehydrogenase family)